jgi:hypothetical protein
VVEQECGPTRDPPRPASIDMGPHIRNGIGQIAADDTGDVPHRQNVYIIDAPPRDDSVAPERQKHMVVQKHGQTLTSALHARGRAALAPKRSRPARAQKVALHLRARYRATECVVLQLHRQDFVLSRTIRVDRHGATHRKRWWSNAADECHAHCPNVYKVDDVLRDDSVAPERRNRDLRPATRDPQPSTIDHPSSTRNPQPATRDPRPLIR